MGFNLNQVITYLLYLMKLAEASILKFINQYGGHSYQDWDEFMNSMTTTTTEPIPTTTDPVA